MVCGGNEKQIIAKLEEMEKGIMVDGSYQYRVLVKGLWKVTYEDPEL